MTDPAALRAALDDILPLVEGPARYLGLERTPVRKPWGSVRLRVVLAFPDAYEIGMSPPGHADPLPPRQPAPRRPRRARLRALAGHGGAPCAPHGVPLYSPRVVPAGARLRPRRHLAAVRAQLRQRPLPPRPGRDPAPGLGAGRRRPAGDRRRPVHRQPRAGGRLLRRLPGRATPRSCSPPSSTPSATPAPRGSAGSSCCAGWPRMPGVYVPRLYRCHGARSEVRRVRWERLDPAAPVPVLTGLGPGLDPADIPPLPLVPSVEVVQDRLGLEVMRGCTQGCRFCQAGYWYRPVREHDPAAAFERMPDQDRRHRLRRGGAALPLHRRLLADRAPGPRPRRPAGAGQGLASACPACAPTPSRSSSPTPCRGCASPASPSPPRPAPTACAGSSTRTSPTPTWWPPPRPRSSGAGT